MKYEIDIDLGPLADEWEPVRIGVPIGRENYLVASRGEVISNDNHPSFITRIIVRRRWKWPEWVTAEWIAMNANCRWYCYSSEPSQGGTTWRGENCNWINGSCFLFIPPPYTDWTQSKRRNPNAKATT